MACKIIQSINVSNNELIITVIIGNKPCKFLVDTGATVSVIKRGICRNKILPSDMVAKGVTGDQVKIFGTQDVNLLIGSRKIVHTFVLCELPYKYDGIMGIDLLRKLGAKVDVKGDKLFIQARDEELVNLFKPVSESGKGPATSNLIEMPGKWRVTSVENVTLPPMSEAVIQGRLEPVSGSPSVANYNEVVVEASQVDDECCIFIGRSINRPFVERVVGAPRYVVYVRVMNCSLDEVVLHKNKLLTYAEECHVEDISGLDLRESINCCDSWEKSDVEIKNGVESHCCCIKHNDQC